MQSDAYVVDTNVWMFAAKDLSQIADLAELACAEACLSWISQFFDSQSRLVVGWDYQSLGEYRRNANPRMAIWLNSLERQPRTYLVEVAVEWDEAGDAKLPSEFQEIDRSDRKFLAALLKHCETCPQTRLVNASDTDWSIAIERHLLPRSLILELCPEYIAQRR